MNEEKKQPGFVPHSWNSSALATIIVVVVLVIMALGYAWNWVSDWQEDRKTDSQTQTASQILDTSSLGEKMEEIMIVGKVYEKRYKDGMVKAIIAISADDWSEPVMIPYNHNFESSCMNCKLTDVFEVMIKGKIYEDGHTKQINLSGLQPPVSLRYRAKTEGIKVKVQYYPK